jgi:hypothetical protein
MDAKHAKCELTELLLAVVAGECTDEQRSHLELLVTGDKALALYAVELLHQEAWLAEHYSELNGKGLLSTLIDIVESESATGTSVSPTAKTQPAEYDLLPDKAGADTLFPSRQRLKPHSNAWNWLAASVLVMIGAAGGSLISHWTEERPTTTLAAADTQGENQQHYDARFVQNTACIWEPGRLPPRVGGGTLRDGESFNLMEGLAEIELTSVAANATVWMEGPARMTLAADGSPILMQGRFTAHLHPRIREIALDIPFGQILVSDKTSLGVAINGLEVECHVFSGEIEVLSPWVSQHSDNTAVQIKAGESVRYFVQDDRTQFDRDVAKPWQFATQSTMVADKLEITPDYVSAVKQAKPLVYWRFERDQNGIIPNEIGDRFQGILHGNVGWSQQGSNRAIEFGLGEKDKSLRAFVDAAEPFGTELSEGYSIEFWVKPSHYHLGTLVSLLRDSGGHGALIELGGTLATPSNIEHAGQFRYLHRNPPSDIPESGTSCFSKPPYEARRWFHVVGVKNSGELRLYSNGQLVASAKDGTQLADGLTLLIAQIDRQRDLRAFVGQLDELAIYPYPLDEKAIKQHFELVRPVEDSLDKI